MRIQILQITFLLIEQIIQLLSGVNSVFLYKAYCLGHLLKIGELDFTGISAAGLRFGTSLQVNDQSKLCVKVQRSDRIGRIIIRWIVGRSIHLTF